MRYINSNMVKCLTIKAITRCVALFLFCLLPLKGACQTGEDAVNALVEMGFENVRVGVEDNVVYAAFEDPVYRGTYRGFGIMLEQLSQYYLDAERFEIVVLDSKVPKVCVHASHVDSRWSLEADYEVENAMAILDNTDENGNSFGKIDVTFHPKVSIDNHRFDVLYEYAVAIAPSIETT